PTDAVLLVTTIAVKKTTVKRFIGCRMPLWRLVPDTNDDVSQADDFPRVHDAVRVERCLDAAHDGNRLAVFGDEEIHFAVANAVFAGAGAFHCQGSEGTCTGNG